MSDIKDLFNSKTSNKLLEASTQKEVGSSVESADYLKSNIEDKKRVIPHVDFASASNFAIFGSAEKYYEDAYNYVLNEYPYDGSLKEKINWNLSGTYLDRYIFENNYPRTTGYINFGNSYGAVTQKTKGYDQAAKNEWIYFKGHNVGYSLNSNENPTLNLQFDNLNIYNTASQGLSNLELEGSGGVSVEFWLKKESFNSSNESRRQVVVDVWNSASWGTDGYGRFRVEISGTDSNVVNPNFHVELLSGTTGFSADSIAEASPTIILSGSTLTGSWNHFALTFENTGSQMVGRLYTNGSLTYTKQAGTTIGTVTGSLLGQVGSLIADVSGSTAIYRGYGKLSASLDEFRFWKTRRTGEQVGRHWFTQVAGGTNTDLTLAPSASTKYSYENPADLGVYYKFNEGIVNTSSIVSQDITVLDYAGRVTNGVWTGYTLTSRNTGSAIVSASAAPKEFADPILYATHPLVSSALNLKKEEGLFYDRVNNSSIYGSLPDWITAEDRNKSSGALKDLTQIMASYFDSLYLQTQTVTSLKDKDYISGSDKPFPFVNRFIDSSGFLTSEIYSKASDLEYLDARNDKKIFLDKVDELKNLIYQNIYNNLVYIYKTKGTEKSFRNLIRGFGVDDELINIRLYGNEVTHKILDNYQSTVVKKKYVDFHGADRMEAVVFQQTASSNSYSRGYIGSAENLINTKAFDFGSKPGSDPGAAIQLNDTSFTGSGGSFSISLWSKQNWQGTQQSLAGRMSTASTWGNGDWGFSMDRPSNGANRMGISTSNGYKEAQINSSERVDDGAWHLVVGGFDAATEKVWINIDNGAATDDSPTGGGVLSGSWGTMSMSLGNVYDGAAGIADYQATTQWSGSMDEVAFWSGSLSTGDINEIYNVGCPGNLENHTNAALLKSWYRMGDLSTDSATANTGEITDVMGNNDGTPKNTDGNEIVTRSGCVASSLQYRGNTYELETFFPKDKEKGTSVYFNASFPTASIFGCHTSGTAGTTAWGSPDYGQFQVQSVRPDFRRKAAFFQLTCSNDGTGIIPKLTSSVFQDVYDGTRWNFAVRIKPKKYPLAAGVSGSNNGQYDVEFSGYNYVLDILNNSFLVTASVPATDAQNFLKANKRFFVGAHRTNTTGSVLQQSNVKASSLRVWMDYLTSNVLEAHAKDVTNFGSANPYRDAYITETGTSLGSKNVKSIPQLETLILNWDFDLLTGSNTTGNFTVQDVSIASSGSNDYTSRWGWLGPIGQYQHTGYGFGFPASDTGSIDQRYVQTLIAQPPEVINSSNMISLIDEDQNKLFTKDSRPEQYFFAFEKSMYNIITKEMIDVFGTIVDFNNLIGEPVNRYRQEYKNMQKLRQLYFERVQNDLDLDKFVEYFKWLDSSISVMLQQLVPAGTRFSENLRTMVESHALERNKYWSKFPTLEMKQSVPESGLFGINELLYPGKRGLAPIPTTATGSNCEWWHRRAERGNSNITSGDATIDSQRNTFRRAEDFRSGSGPTLAVSRDSTDTTTTYEGQAYAIRNFTKIYNLTADEAKEIHGGSNFAKNKTVEYTHEALKFGSSEQLSIDASSIPSGKGGDWKGCKDVVEPNAKFKIHGKLKNSGDTQGYTSGKTNIFAPFSLFSSSNQSGYMDSFAAALKNIDITNYHDDIYGDDKGIPAQGPFTNAHVGGRQHRHIPINTSSTTTTDDRAEAWNLDVTSNPLTITTRTAHQPRATMIRDAYAKRPLNIANLKWGTSSAVAGNYRFGYEILQTSGRSLNNRFFIANGGFSPTSSDTGIFSGAIDYLLPRYDLIGTNKSIFVERFNAPGGPEVSSRGCMDVNAEEYSVYNQLNYRNLIVRTALDSWLTQHCGQFGISPTGSPGDGTTPSEHQTNPMSYDGVIAAYQKVNRNTIHQNPRSNSWIKWTTFLGDMTATDNGIVDSGVASSPPAFDDYAFSQDFIYKRGTFEANPFGVSSSAGGTAYMGLVGESKRGQTATVSETTIDWPFAWKVYQGSIIGGKNIVIAQTVVDGSPSSFSTPAAYIQDIRDQLRLKISVDSATVEFLYSLNGGDTWTVGQIVPTTNFNSELYAAAVTMTSPQGFAYTKLQTFQYDNWYVQHDLPQSTLQYAWIRESYDKTKNQPLGYAGGCHDAGGIVPFSVPSGTTSMTASSVLFITSSCWEPGAVDYECWPPGGLNFAQYDFGVQAGASDPSIYKYTLTSSQNMLSPGSAFLNTEAGGVSIHGNIQNLNGPYGYPSWKQIRTGETPVARYHKRNNILSLTKPRNITLKSPNGQGPESYFNARADSFTNYVEPPVTFKHRPLISHLDANVDQFKPVSLKHTYGNNKCLWTQRGLPLNNTATASIGTFLGTPNEKKDKQMYEKLRTSPNYQASFSSLIYSEVIYPRAANTGLARTRARTQYAETAATNGASPPTASLSIGSNGIDRGPLERRTFWRNADYNRNRYSAPMATSVGSPYARFQTTISNSCGNQDGHARSVWSFGTDPLVYNPPSLNPALANVGAARLSASVNPAIPNNGLDTGELNSINIYKIGGFMGGVTGSIDPDSYAHDFYIKPSASAFYYWLPNYGAGEFYKTGSYYTNFNAASASVVENTMALFNKGMRWQTAIDAGKNPFYDSYEAFAENIRGLSQTHTVIPEFRISDNMEYYVKTAGGNFRAQNDKFLSLDGAAITSSATNFSTSDGVTDYNTKFFKEYSFSDFQKYFGKFSNNHQLNKITLKCNAVKKLLPYKGFYPSERSIQLASLFSQSLGSLVGGGAITSSTNTAPTRIQSGSQQLALQSLMQPWFGPGILYNTIKSGVGVDWPIFTGSTYVFAEPDIYTGYKFINSNPNERFPFKSLLDPLNYVPDYKSDGTHRLLYVAPSYIASEPNREPPRVPFAEFTERPPAAVMDLYSSAMHNYLAEIPNFFLQNQELQSIISRPQGDVTIEENKVYVMDTYIEKTNTSADNELIMIQDYYNGYVSESFGYFASSSYPSDDEYNLNGWYPSTVWGPPGSAVTGSWNGKYFGPKFNCETNTNNNPDMAAWYAGNVPFRDCDPAFAPVTPPYFYGKAKVRLIYTGSAEDAQTLGSGNGPNWRKILNNMTMSFKTSDDPRRSAWSKFYNNPYGDQFQSPAYVNMMDVTASLNIKGVMVENPSDASLNRWVISPHMETPVLDFSESQTPERGYGRGMWSGYGQIPKNNKGIFFGITRPSDEFLNRQNVEDMTQWFSTTPADSFSNQTTTDASGRTRAASGPRYVGQSMNKKIGQIAAKKTISEAIVAIPFCTTKILKSSGMAATTHRTIMGKNFFSLNGNGKPQARALFNDIRANKLNTDFAIPEDKRNQYNVNKPISNTSVSTLAQAMDKYIFPPELDFNKYDDGPTAIQPFVMYVLEFEHELDDDELKDIWQGVMPEIAMVPELDTFAVSHEMKSYEFFGGKPLPPDNQIRWMIFKVKQRAAVNYYAQTKDSSDAPTNRIPAFMSLYSNPVGNLDYSYNWPYDNFSLVELAQVEPIERFSGPPTNLTVRDEPRPFASITAQLGDIPGSEIGPAKENVPCSDRTVENRNQRLASQLTAQSDDGDDPVGGY